MGRPPCSAKDFQRGTTQLNIEGTEENFSTFVTTRDYRDVYELLSSKVLVLHQLQLLTNTHIYLL